MSYSPSRSSFVTSLAWVFIVLSGFGTLVTALQNAVLGPMMGDVFKEALADTAAVSAIPGGVPKFIIGHVRLIIALGFATSAVTLVTSIGLLKRQNWARLLFIAILGLGVVYSLLSVILPLTFPMPSSITQTTADSTFQRTIREFDQTFRLFKLVMVVMALGFAGLFGWLIAKLLSAPVRAEFVAADRAG